MTTFDPLDAGHTLPAVIGRRATEDGDEVFLRDLDHGTVHSYAGFDNLVDQWRDVLSELGLRKGKAVVTLLPNCADGVAVWLAAARLGAVEAPVNPAYRGKLLTHMIGLAEAGLVIVAREHMESLAAVIADIDVSTIVVVDPAGSDEPVPRLDGVRVLRAVDRLGMAPATPGDPHAPQPWDLSCLLYTSGTTGPSKGVMVTWAQAMMTVVGCFPPEEMTSTDHWYVPYPLFHMSGRLCVYGAALLGSEAVVRRRFSLSGWWDDIDTHGCTTALVIGAVPQLLSGRPHTSADAAHSLRHVQMAPMPENAREFAERFRVRLNTVFNMTEISVATHTNWKPWKPGSVGRVRPGYEVRIVDEHDREVPAGDTGEIIVRADTPWVLNQGYWGMPEKTVEAWRNGWFHTGDAGYVDDEGWFFFVDRFKDAIRRSGENISSMELEAEVAEHPTVRECAAIGVPSDLGEEEVLVFLVPEAGAIEFDAVLEHCQERLPKFMVPRYLAVRDELPKTPTEKIRKTELKDAWRGVEVWDAQTSRLTRL